MTIDRRSSLLLLLALYPALSGFDLFLRRDPNLEAGNRALQAGKPDEALSAYDRAVSELPDEPVARFDRGTALYALKRYPEAQKEFQRAAEGHDAELKADAYYNMGNALYQQERWKEALDAYKHTLGLRPDDRRAKWNLEMALAKLREDKQKQQQQQQQQQKSDGQKSDQQQSQSQQPQDAQQSSDQKQDQKQQQQAQQQQAQQQPAKPDDKNDPKDGKAADTKQPPDKDQKTQQASAGDKKDDKDQKSPKEQNGQKDQKGQAGQPVEPARDIDRQDAEAVLDALERVEPTVQKDLARRRAGDRRPTKDW